jgi:F-type H+-transporting ATPase subunit gamma
MSNVKEIKRRINTVQNIEHVTDAIQKIAATRLYKIKNRMSSLKKYKAVQKQLFFYVSNSEIFYKPNPQKPNLLIIITSDKGLCGGFNERIYEALNNYLKKDPQCQLIIAGKKGITYLERMQLATELQLPNIPAFCTVKDFNTLNNYILKRISSNEANQILVLYTEFISISNLNPCLNQIFPIEIDSLEKKTNKNFIIEPDAATIINNLFPQYLNLQILVCFAESITAEHTARMVMMERASKSAKDMINELTTERNKKRQAVITKELSEIVGTTDSLESK